jgi:hypothetical protein
MAAILTRWRRSTERRKFSGVQHASLQDAVESLSYWRSRRARLPWYRRSARREAAQMMLRWERRVRAAVVRQTDAPPAARIAAARLVACTYLARWGRRAGIAFVAVSAMFAMVAGATFALVLYAL